MKQTTLQFDNILSLIDFLDVIHQNHCDFVRRDLAVTAGFSDAEIELAINGYNAKVLPASLNLKDGRC